MIKDYARLAFVSLRKRRLRSWLTMIGIFIGIASVVSLISLGEGLRQLVVSQFNLLGTDVLTITASGVAFGPPGSGAINPLKESYLSDIERIVGAKTAIGRNIEEIKLEFNGRSDFTYLASVPEEERRKEFERIVQIEIADGRNLKDSDEKKVVLGSNYANADRFGKAVRTGDSIFIKGKPYEVVGILEKKGSFIVDGSVLLNERVVKDVFEVNDSYDIMVVVAKQGYDLGSLKERVENYLRKERDVKKGEEDFSVQSPEQQLKDLNAILFAVQFFLYSIAAISLIVGGIGIANTMYTSVIERTKQIGIMKSIGAQKNDIFTIFLIESGFLGLVGGILGIFIGLGFAYVAQVAAQSFTGTDLIKMTVPWVLPAGALAFSFVIGSIAGLMPALHAAKLKPVDALNETR